MERFSRSVLQAVHHRTVFVHHALGASGRTRGVHDIHQMLGCQLAAVQIAHGLSRPSRCIPLYVERRNTATLQQLLNVVRDPRVGQHSNRSAVLQHISQAIQRIRRVQRYVRSAGFQHRQQPNQHLRAALHTQRHPRIGSSADAAQIPRQLIGTGVELAIGQLRVFVRHRDGTGVLRNLNFEQLVQAAIRRISRRGRVPLHQDPMALRLWKQRQPPH